MLIHLQGKCEVKLTHYGIFYNHQSWMVKVFSFRRFQDIRPGTFLPFCLRQHYQKISNEQNGENILHK
ncbi:hypothetical protein AEW48_23680 [Salmonella enterica subsp. enterica serovar Schwarzengrund]|nr:hypothetical protein AEU02_19875 [Salmonella enterica subsp. enterica serovar Schwarzengrund]KNS35020.1 hypothetical protein AEW20_25590 [Salmonella enterica subsp. enterica serovar Heidelberg]OEC16356.1 hypothetical protein A8275_24985 [Salmonella enterica subsp. enterica serovar Typhimurium]KNK82089.1 hypothetical protein AEU51_12925 [Salmonella enterica subsp. enterica serovar Schwarzengrund]KNP53185.1 hypothetical protein AEV75_23660 [Salmonella enterica subsp. enterica serovar Schwarzen